jgi:hypothetical protein
MTRPKLLDEISAELTRQDSLWGEQNHPDGTGGPVRRQMANAQRDLCELKAQRGEVTYRDILAEEVAEAFAESYPTRLREELIQVAAVAVAWIEAIDRSNT